MTFAEEHNTDSTLASYYHIDATMQLPYVLSCEDDSGILETLSSILVLVLSLLSLFLADRDTYVYSPLSTASSIRLIRNCRCS